MADRKTQLGGEYVTIHDQGSSNWALAVANQTYSTVATGEHISGTAISVVGTAASRYVYLMADAGNSGTVYIGGTSVTVSNGTADQTTGWQLTAGDTFGPLPLSNVNVLSSVASADDQKVIYFALS